MLKLFFRLITIATLTWNGDFKAARTEQLNFGSRNIKFSNNRLKQDEQQADGNVNGRHIPCSTLFVLLICDLTSFVDRCWWRR